MKNLLVCWSGGKDSAMTLHHVCRNGQAESITLLTTLTRDYDRVSMHGVRRVLLEQQVESLGFPLQKVLISKDTSNDGYDAAMRDVLERLKEAGIDTVAFGDIFSLIDVNGRHQASGGGGDVVFHLHRFHFQQHVSRFDPLPFRDQHLDHQARQRRGDYDPTIGRFGRLAANGLPRRHGRSGRNIIHPRRWGSRRG